MLVTYIYGDIPSLALCLLSVYFMIKYVKTKEVKYAVFASIFTMIAYMMRMNSLIFIIATVIYLLLNLFKDFKQTAWKKSVLSLTIVAIYVIISVTPTILVKNYYFDKYNLDKNKIYPNTSYLLMAMEEGPRENGWYNEKIAEQALKDPENAKNEYTEKIKERLIYFKDNLDYTIDFYIKKISSMWTENTYSAVIYNKIDENNLIEKISSPLAFYQKASLITLCVCCIIVLIQNRKNISLEIIFLLTIFIGGFAFHILWEAKSRYIIPYIIVLIPIASISINKFKFGKNKKRG